MGEGWGGSALSLPPPKRVLCRPSLSPLPAEPHRQQIGGIGAAGVVVGELQTEYQKGGVELVGGETRLGRLSSEVSR